MRGPALTASMALLTLSLSACATSLVRSGAPPGRTAPGYEDRWQSAFLFGTQNGLTRHDLDRACPAGWAEIRLGPDPFTLLAAAATLFVYTPSRVTVVCAKQPGDDELPF